MSDISFLTISSNILDPGAYIEFDNSKAVGVLPAQPRRMLIIGQRAANAAVLAGVPTRLFKPLDGATYFGRGSMLAAMIAAARTANDSAEMWAIALDDNSAGAAAVWAATFTGTATATGTLTLYIGGTAVQIAVATGMTAVQAAAALVTAIEDLPDLPVTAAVDGTTASKVDITCNWKGVSGNDLDFRTTYYQGDQGPAGLTLATTVTTAGTANPVITPAIVAMGNVWYNDIAMPYWDTANKQLLATELERRGGSTVQQDGMSWTCIPGTVGSLSSFGEGRNEKFECNLGMVGSPTPSWTIDGTLTAIANYYLAIDPAAPLSDIILPGVLAPKASDQLQHPDREALLHDGISTTIVDSGGNVLLSRLVTAYLTNPQGITDQSYLDVETMSTLSYLRYWVRARIAASWPRYKLADDPTAGQSLPAGQRVTCPKLVGLDLIAGAGDLEDAGIIENAALFAQQLVVQRNSTNRDEVDSILPYTLIGRFRVFAGQIQFRL